MKRSKSSRILKILSYVLLITGMIVILYPFYLTIITALKTPQESSQSFFSFPQSFYLGNFVNVLQKANYFVFFRNSAVVTLVSVFLIMVLIPMCSYAIARNMEKRYYKTMYFYLLAGIFVPFQVIMVPLVKYLAKLNQFPNFIASIWYISPSSKYASVSHFLNRCKTSSLHTVLHSSKITRSYFFQLYPFFK